MVSWKFSQVADTQNNANLAAKLALVNYDTEGLDPPILTVEEAVEQSSFFDVPPFLYPQKVGDFSKGMAEADHKILSAEVHCFNCFPGLSLGPFHIFLT